MSLIIFFISTIIYFIIQYSMLEKYSKRTPDLMLYFILGSIYFTFNVAAQININMKATKIHCGEAQIMTSIIWTLIPNLLIFGLGMVLLYLFSGWKSPFSNTIGYGIAKILGIRNLLNKILPPKEGNEFVQKISEDQSILLNKFTPNNFDIMIGEMKESMNFKDGYEEYIPQFYNLVVIKDMTSRFIWYSLLGLLVMFQSYNTIMSIECNRSPNKLLAGINNSIKEKADKEKNKRIPKEQVETQ